jgi:hypothetical protein
MNQMHKILHKFEYVLSFFDSIVQNSSRNKGWRFHKLKDEKEAALTIGPYTITMGNESPMVVQQFLVNDELLVF